MRTRTSTASDAPARAGKEGTAITFVGEWDLDAWEQIREEVGAEVEEGSSTSTAERRLNRCSPPPVP